MITMNTIFLHNLGADVKAHQTKGSPELTFAPYIHSLNIFFIEIGSLLQTKNMSLLAFQNMRGF